MRGFVVQNSASQSPPAPALDPEVWLINKLHVDEDDQPLQEGIFSNYNDDIVVEVDEGTLVGRTSQHAGLLSASSSRPP